jgi:hypothetical protein
VSEREDETLQEYMARVFGAMPFSSGRDSGGASSMSHTCAPPTIASATAPSQPDWICRICGRAWRDMHVTDLRWWAEIRGPKPERESP